MRSLASKTFFGLTLAAGLALLPACDRKKGRDAKGPKILHLVMSDDVKSADPATANDTISAELLGHVFEGLLNFSYLGNTDSVSPLLAAQMPVYSNKNKTITIHLKQGVLFQDDAAFPGGKGRELVAEDFIYSIKRVADPRVSSSNWWLLDGIVEGLNDWRTTIEKAPADQRNALFQNPVKGLQAPDPHTFVMQLVKPYPQLPYVLSMPATAAVAREVVEKYGPEIINHPVGTGPFRLKSWIRGSKLIVEKSPTFRKDYYPTAGSADDVRAGLLQASGKEVPFVKEIQWDIIKEEQPRWLKFRAGELDVSGIPKEHFLDVIDSNSQLKPDLLKEGIQLRKELTLTSWWIEFNLKDPILGKNLKLRQAIGHAFDRARALEILQNNRGILANSPVPQTLEGGAEAPPNPYAYDLAKAKALMVEAGYPEGKGLPELTYDLRGPGTTSRQLGEFFRDNLAKIGIKLSVLGNSFPEALEKAKTGHFQMMLAGWLADYPDPENFLQLFYGPNAAPGPNSANFNNKDYNALYEQIRTQLPSPERKKAISKMIDILQKEAVGIYYYHEVDYILNWNWLKNYKPQLFYFGSGKFLDLDLKP